MNENSDSRSSYEKELEMHFGCNCWIAGCLMHARKSCCDNMGDA